MMYLPLVSTVCLVSNDVIVPNTTPTAIPPKLVVKNFTTANMYKSGVISLPSSSIQFILSIVWYNTTVTASVVYIVGTSDWY